MATVSLLVRLSVHDQTMKHILPALALLEGSEMPVESITGLPYVYDPEAHTLDVPNDPRLHKFLVNNVPLKLPRVRESPSPE